MKEMEYKTERNIEILHSGEYDGRKFAILSTGYHPTAYVELKPEELNKSNKYSDYDLDVHCGFTYLGVAHWDDTDKTMYIGWDYAHYGDYSGLWEEFHPINFYARKWTTEEIFREVKNVIEQFKKAKWVKDTKDNYTLKIEED